MDVTTLPSGATVNFRDINTIKSGDRKRLLKTVDNLGGGELAKGLDMIDGFLALIIEGWSFDLPLPITGNIESLEELSLPDYDALQAAAEPLMKQLFPNFEPNPTPGSPTGT